MDKDLCQICMNSISGYMCYHSRSGPGYTNYHASHGFLNYCKRCNMNTCSKCHCCYKCGKCKLCHKEGSCGFILGQDVLFREYKIESFGKVGDGGWIGNYSRACYDVEL